MKFESLIMSQHIYRIYGTPCICIYVDNFSFINDLIFLRIAYNILRLSTNMNAILESQL